MNNLLSKPLRVMILYASVILMLSVPVYFFVVDHIWLEELDENNDIIAERAIYQLHRTDFEAQNLDSLLKFWNVIQPNSRIEPDQQGSSGKKVRYTVYKSHVNPDYKLLEDRFRVLEAPFELKGNKYKLVVESNVEETYETAGIIALITLSFLALLCFGFITLIKRMSARLWQPFRDTLDKLKDFRVDTGDIPDFPKSDISEFTELHQALERLMTKNIDVFNIQKEFTENVSHELQTPLAILQTELGVLFRSQPLTEEQYDLIERTHKALARAVRLNNDLLLLAKVANNQFVVVEDIDMQREILDMADLLENGFHRKSIKFTVDAPASYILSANKLLVTTLLQNLFTNALKYTPQNGEVQIILRRDRLTVANSGNNPLDKEKMFRRFARLTENMTSTGIGLALAQTICKNNNWSLNYSFHEGQHRFEVHFT